MNNDLISRSELKRKLHNFFDGITIVEPAYILRDVFYYIDNAPTVTLSNLTTSDIDELCRLRSDLKSGLYVGSTLRTQAQMNKFIGVLDDIIDNAPTVEERPQGEWGKNGECPFCSYIRQWEDDNFCGNCGAKMSNSV